MVPNAVIAKAYAITVTIGINPDTNWMILKNMSFMPNHLTKASKLLLLQHLQLSQ